MSSFFGLYYPGETWNLDTEDPIFKKCLFLFDKIYAIFPEIFSVDWDSVQPYEELATFSMNARLNTEDERLRIKKAIDAGNWPSDRREPYLPEIERYDRITRFLDKVNILRKEGILELVDPRKNLLDPLYRDSSSRSYTCAEIVDYYQKAVRHGISVDELEAYKPHILYGSVLNDLKDRDFRALATRIGTEHKVLYKGQIEQDWLSLLGRSSGFPEDEWQWFPAIGLFCGDLVGTVSTSMWAAFVINQILLTAHRYNLIPVTPSDTFNELVLYKSRHLRTLIATEQLRRGYFNHPEYRTEFSSLSLVASTLPNLEGMSFEDILELRLTLEDELSPIREQMSILAERVRLEPWEPHFTREIEHITKHDIEPVVQKLKRKLVTIPSEASLRVLKSPLPNPTSLSMLATIWTDLPPLLVMGIAAGLTRIETVLEYYFDHKKMIQSNGLSLLLQLS